MGEVQGVHSRLCPWGMAAKFTLVSLLSVTLVGCSMFGKRSYEMPKYDVVYADQEMEIRHYQSYLVAKTCVKGSYKSSQNSAFRILAGYIFGGNEAQQKISMTGPVTHKPSQGDKGKQSLRAPDSQASSDASSPSWEMAFMMPAQFTRDSLPVPKDERVTFEEVPKQWVAVIKYSGIASQENNAKQARRLMDWLHELSDYHVESVPFFAGYDPPWTLPFLRRNEMMIQISNPA